MKRVSQVFFFFNIYYCLQRFHFLWEAACCMLYSMDVPVAMLARVSWSRAEIKPASFCLLIELHDMFRKLLQKAHIFVWPLNIADIEGVLLDKSFTRTDVFYLVSQLKLSLQQCRDGIGKIGRLIPIELKVLSIPSGLILFEKECFGNLSEDHDRILHLATAEISLRRWLERGILDCLDETILEKERITLSAILEACKKAAGVIIKSQFLLKSRLKFLWLCPNNHHQLIAVQDLWNCFSQ